MPRRYQRLPAEGFQTCAQPGQVPARLPGGEVSQNLRSTSGFSSFFLPDKKIARARALPGKHQEQRRNWGFDEEHVHTHSRQHPGEELNVAIQKSHVKGFSDLLISRKAQKFAEEDAACRDESAKTSLEALRLIFRVVPRGRRNLKARSLDSYASRSRAPEQIWCANGTADAVLSQHSFGQKSLGKVKKKRVYTCLEVQAGVRVRLCCGATWDSITTCKSMLLHTSTDSKQTRKAGTGLHCKLLKHFTKFPTGTAFLTLHSLATSTATSAPAFTEDLQDKKAPLQGRVIAAQATKECTQNTLSALAIPSCCHSPLQPPAADVIGNGLPSPQQQQRDCNTGSRQLCYTLLQRHPNCSI
ncbi:hypothetical protein Anapl_10588 [Anas platyrhynchos]|uniref:Uncharacterized protein n=1 Tax=Anas platyrhynchos TaxID=8839 RepID=R0KF55_ANAPL|nr:hypothetical protein Anapl_10588 [Anas platyrhynchos]